MKSSSTQAKDLMDLVLGAQLRLLKKQHKKNEAKRARLCKPLKRLCCEWLRVLFPNNNKVTFYYFANDYSSFVGGVTLPGKGSINFRSEGMPEGSESLCDQLRQLSAQEVQLTEQMREAPDKYEVKLNQLLKNPHGVKLFQDFETKITEVLANERGTTTRANQRTRE